MFYQNSLLGVPKNPVYCRVANDDGGGNSASIPLIYRLKNDQSAAAGGYSILGLGDPRNMCDPVGGTFTAPEPGIYLVTWSVYGASSLNVSLFARDLVSNKYISYANVVSTGRSYSTSFTVPLYGTEKIAFFMDSVQLANFTPEGNTISFLKMYDLPVR